MLPVPSGPPRSLVPPRPVLAEAAPSGQPATRGRPRITVDCWRCPACGHNNGVAHATCHHCQQDIPPDLRTRDQANQQHFLQRHLQTYENDVSNCLLRMWRRFNKVGGCRETRLCVNDDSLKDTGGQRYFIKVDLVFVDRYARGCEVLFFTPGPRGFTINSDCEVAMVQADQQAARLGVEIGWRVIVVDGYAVDPGEMPSAVELLDRASAAGCKYEVMFQTPAVEKHRFQPHVFSQTYKTSKCGKVLAFQPGHGGERFRVKPGWQIQEIDGQPFSPNSLTASDNGGADFEITFLKPQKARVDLYEIKQLHDWRLAPEQIREAFDLLSEGPAAVEKRLPKSKNFGLSRNGEGKFFCHVIDMVEGDVRADIEWMPASRNVVFFSRHDDPSTERREQYIRKKREPSMQQDGIRVRFFPDDFDDVLLDKQCDDVLWQLDWIPAHWRQRHAATPNRVGGQ